MKILTAAHVSNALTKPKQCAFERLASKAIVSMFLLWVGQAAHGQGTFQNLNFEAARVSGYTPGSPIPMSAAMPGWSVTSPGYTWVAYDGLSLGGAAVSICDSNTMNFTVLQGRFSAFLFGGEYGPASISQTGVVPASALSLQMEVGTGWRPTLFNVSLGAQPINMIPLASYSSYTLYGGDISWFSGQVATLTLTAPTPPSPQIPPSFFPVDEIVFSPQAIPEPDVRSLFALGGLFLGSRIFRSQRSEISYKFL
jgi:hypothetical protein